MLTAERARELLDYNPDTGLFAWRVNRRNIKAGTQAGGFDLDGYVMIGVDGVRYKAHRIAFLIVTGAWPNGDVDHINRNPSDNRWANLRPATRAENTANAAARVNSRSGVRGVCLTKKGWKAQIKVAGKNKHLGYFPTADDAGVAYRTAAKRAFGEFAA